ncbi:MAG: substrate-binding domain-containing protein [Bacillota bacterium]
MKSSLNLSKYYLFKSAVLLLFIALLLTSCQTNNQQSKKIEKKIFGVSMASMDQDVFPIMKDAMFDSMKRDYVEIIWLNADNKEEKQTDDINYLLKKDVDLIIINPVDSENANKLVKKINKKNIPVVALDRIVKNVPLSAYITSDSFRVGIEQAKYLAEKIDQTGKILILKGDKKNNIAFEITAGNKKILKKNIKINIIEEKWHKAWSPDLAEQTVRKTLAEHPDIKGIMANNSAMAMAAVKVLKEMDMTEKVVTIGADASKDACIAIAKGEHDADIDKMPYIQGLAAFKSALMISKEKKWNYNQRLKSGEYSIPVKLTPIMLIDKYNLITMKDRWSELDKYIKEIE